MTNQYEVSCKIKTIPNPDGISFIQHHANQLKYRVHDFVAHPEIEGIEYCLDCGKPRKQA